MMLQPEKINTIYETLQADGVNVTKQAIKRVIDEYKDLLLNDIIDGYACLQGICSIKVARRKARLCFGKVQSPEHAVLRCTFSKTLKSAIKEMH